MKYQEKKYRVDSFSDIQKILHHVHAKKGEEVISVHYYAEQEGNTVVKLVSYKDRHEIHILNETNGMFSLTENFQVESKELGLHWLKNKGYSIVNIVKMNNIDYPYKGGIVGLYIIDDFLHSVILDFPENKYESLAKEFGLDTATIIQVPYNVYLKHINRLRTMVLK
jgi:hypothetical protein